MATVIRSPRLNKKPRKLHGAEAVEPKAVESRAAEPNTVETGAQPVTEMRIKESPETYAVPEERIINAPVEPAITAEQFAGLERRAELAESRAAAAERELSTVESDLESLRVTAREEGFAAGREEANNRLDAEFQQKLQSVQQVLHAVSAELQKLVLQAEDSIVETVYATVVRIIGDQLIGPEGIVALVKHVSAQLVRPENFIVRLAPEDYELITAGSGRISLSQDESAKLKVVPDSRIELGGCILESATGSLDARLEVQLQRLKDVLLDSRARRQSELLGKK
jgi:flagellar assembly protein FliH